MSAKTRFTDDELLQLHNRLSELEEEPLWRRRCFFIRFMFATGMKSGEVLPLRLEDILLDHDPPVIRVPNSRRSRYIQVNLAWAPRFRSYIRNIKERRPSHAFLFPGRSAGQPSCRETMQYWWREALKAAGLRHVPLEKGTHGFGVWESKRLPSRGILPHGDKAR